MSGEATLQQLGVTLLLGLAVSLTTLVLFAVALRFRCTHIAPRAEARPRDVIYNPYASDPSQDRGNVLFGWAIWLMQLSYQKMIEGVPGTGTRNGGLEGHLLSINLDHILLLRFHALGLRIAFFATVVYCGLALPLYLTSRCFDSPFANNNTQLALNCTDSDAYNLTRYDQLTLANVPPVNEANAFEASQVGVYTRMYVIVLCSYVVCWYTCYELHKEWVDLLAMRRVYYLEADHFARNKELLKATLTSVDQSQLQHKCNHDDNPHLHQREVWIPHPESRDVPPSIGLYSVLVGSLPKRPRQAVSDDDLEAAMSKQKDALDWQLAVTSAFFDYCVPNQPGFSSSVAAVTILPSAAELAAAWKKWYGATKKLQRLRFIRRQLRERGYQKGSEVVPANEPENVGESTSNGSPKTAKQTDYDDDSVDLYLPTSSRRDRYSQEILGCATDEDVERMFLQTLQMGPEQTSVYSVELAMGSSRCCPHGFCEERIRCSSIDQLVKMQAEAVKQARDAFQELETVRRKAAEAVHKQQQSEEINCMGPAATFLLSNNSQGFTETESRRSDTLETRLYGKGQAALELSSMNQRVQRDKLKGRRDQEYLNGQSARTSEADIESGTAISSQNVIADIPLNVTSTNGTKGRESSNKLNGRQRPTLDRERGRYFPSLLTIRVEQGDGTAEDTSTTQGKDAWNQVKNAARESEICSDTIGNVVFRHRVSDGVWNAPSIRGVWKHFWGNTRSLLGWTVTTSDMAADLMARDSTFAVITFTSRQAASAARKCLADGRGAGRWTVVNDIPTPPLADASAFNICDCRGCMRPVTISLNDHQKIWRSYCTKTTVVLIWLFYTIPITWAAFFGSEAASDLIPQLQIEATELNGMIRAQLLNLFLAICPHVFLWLANFGSGATSMVEAEFAALQYYWWFFLLFALLGSSIAQMVLRSFEEGSFKFRETIQTVAATIPSQVSSNWANWIVLKATVFHPLFYLLQIQSFLYAALGLKCCLRCVRGGGAGSRLPYRLYVDSGMVIVFVLAIAPAAPIVAPLAVLYFLVCAPLLRHVLLFTYKPQFEYVGRCANVECYLPDHSRRCLVSGQHRGVRFPFMFEMCISSMIVSQGLLCVMMLLKGGIGPGVLAALLGIPTLVFRRTCHRRFLRAYTDCALLQTSLLDGWVAPEDSVVRTSEGREEFRQFLVDSHKAAYIPACIAGTNTDKILTAEPAVVVPTPTDIDDRVFSSSDLPRIAMAAPQSMRTHRIETFRNSPQSGALLRRNYAGSTEAYSKRAHELPSPASHDHNNTPQEENGVNQRVKVSPLAWIEISPHGETNIIDKREKES